MILNATGTGLFFKTMLYLANQTTDQNQNTMQDFHNSPMGSDMGKYTIYFIIIVNIVWVFQIDR